MTTVYATAQGRAYHATADCQALYGGQSLSDWDFDYEFPPPSGARLPVTHAVRETTPELAAAHGQHPCAACRPPLAAATETFGHKPVVDDREFFGEVSDEPPVCARCTRTIRALTPVVIGQEPTGRPVTREAWTTYEVAVLWPCVSAEVLDIVGREQVSA